MGRAASEYSGERDEMLHALLTLSRALSGDLDVDRGIARTTDALAEALGIRDVSMTLLASTRADAAAGGSDDMPERFAENDVTFATGASGAEAPLDPAEPATRGEVTSLYLPITLDGDVLGVLAARSTPERPLTSEDLPVFEIAAAMVANALGLRRLRQDAASDIRGESLPEQVEKLERRRIAEAMRATGGVRTRAAKLVGLTLRQLGYKLKKYGFDEE